MLIFFSVVETALSDKFCSHYIIVIKKRKKNVYYVSMINIMNESDDGN